MPNHFMVEVANERYDKGHREGLWNQLLEFSWGQDSMKERVERHMFRHLIAKVPAIAAFQGQSGFDEFEAGLKQLALKTGLTYSRTKLFLNSLATACHKLTSSQIQSAKASDCPLLDISVHFDKFMEGKQASAKNKVIACSGFFNKTNGQKVFELVAKNNQVFDKLVHDFNKCSNASQLLEVFTNLYKLRSPISLVAVKLLMETKDPEVNTRPLSSIASKVFGSFRMLLTEAVIEGLAPHTRGDMVDTLADFQVSNELVTAVKSGSLTKELIFDVIVQLRSQQYSTAIECEDMFTAHRADMTFKVLTAILDVIGLGDYPSLGSQEGSPAERADGAESPQDEMDATEAEALLVQETLGSYEDFDSIFATLMSWAREIEMKGSSQSDLKPQIHKQMGSLLEDINENIRTRVLKAIPGDLLPGSPLLPHSKVHQGVETVEKGLGVAKLLRHSGVSFGVAASSPGPAVKVAASQSTRPKKRARKEQDRGNGYLPKDQRMTMNDAKTVLSIDQYRLNVTKFEKDHPTLCPYMALSTKGDHLYCPVHRGADAPEHDKSKYPAGFWDRNSAVKKQYLN